MSGSPEPRQIDAAPRASSKIRDRTELRARREQAKRVTRNARVDLVLGLAGAILLVILSPGLAITALLALLLLLGVAAGALRRARRRARRDRSARL